MFVRFLQKPFNKRKHLFCIQSYYFTSRTQTSPFHTLTFLVSLKNFLVLQATCIIYLHKVNLLARSVVFLSNICTHSILNNIQVIWKMFSLFVISPSHINWRTGGMLNRIRLTSYWMHWHWKCVWNLHLRFNILALAQVTFQGSRLHAPPYTFCILSLKIRFNQDDQTKLINCKCSITRNEDQSSASSANEVTLQTSSSSTWFQDRQGNP